MARDIAKPGPSQRTRATRREGQPPDSEEHPAGSLPAGCCARTRWVPVHAVATRGRSGRNPIAGSIKLEENRDTRTRNRNGVAAGSSRRTSPHVAVYRRELSGNTPEMPLPEPHARTQTSLFPLAKTWPGTARHAPCKGSRGVCAEGNPRHSPLPWEVLPRLRNPVVAWTTGPTLHYRQRGSAGRT